ncbi:MAG: VOC family protein [Halobacteriales archaeon]|nr:VOC family protein [Halobacteriales archaeon]
MAKRPPLVPAITVNDVDKTYEYFTRTLGFTGDYRMKGPTGTTAHAEVYLGKPDGSEARLMMGSLAMAQSNQGYDTGEFGQNLTRGPLGNGVVLYFRATNVDKLYEKLRTNGAVIDEPPTDQFWGDRTISVLTPDNYYLTFAQPIKGFKAPADWEQNIIREAKPKLSTAQRNQRKYAAKVKGIRARAKTTKGGKGRIATRGAARTARRNLGLGRGN